MEGKKRVLLLGNSHLVIFGFRGELIQKLISEGYAVAVSFPNGPFGEGEKTSNEYGCEFAEVQMNRRGKNPFQDIALFIKYLKLIARCKPDVVLAYTVKCDIYGGLACRLLRIPFLPNITGLGKGLTDGGVIEKITKFLYKVAIKKAKCIFFQNEHDENFFKEKIIENQRCVLLPGSGVNLEKFVPLSYPSEKDPVVFTYIARVMKAKGIEQFLDAARIIKKKYQNTEFHICGYCEENYRDIIQKEQKKGTVIYHGLVDNVIDYIRISSCIVLPSFHPEGISNVLLEAAACARPIITTDHAGCRETVDDSVTGYLVKEKDSQDLINSIEQFLSLTMEERCNMGERGRKKVEKEYNRRIIVNLYLDELTCIN